jgi:hypothetical protein
MGELDHPGLAIFECAKQADLGWLTDTLVIKEWLGSCARECLGRCASQRNWHLERDPERVRIATCRLTGSPRGFDDFPRARGASEGSRGQHDVVRQPGDAPVPRSRCVLEPQTESDALAPALHHLLGGGAALERDLEATSRRSGRQSVHHVLHFLRRSERVVDCQPQS